MRKTMMFGDREPSPVQGMTAGVPGYWRIGLQTEHLGSYTVTHPGGFGDNILVMVIGCQKIELLNAPKNKLILALKMPEIRRLILLYCGTARTRKQRWNISMLPHHYAPNYQHDKA